MHALVIDDEPQVRDFVGEVLRDDGWEVTAVESAEQAFEVLQERHWSAIFCDVILGGADGYSVLRRVKEELPQTKVVLMTGHGSALGALDATAFGAYEYLLKPFGVDELHSLSRSLSSSFQAPAQPGRDPRPRPKSFDSDAELVGLSSIFLDVMKQVGRAASTNFPVLLIGESGTGKELVACALHRRSTRAKKPFVVVNCGTIPSESIESELFGHVKGSVPGAVSDRAGLWEGLDGGTIFLNEITDTTPAFQVKLLRAIHDGEIRRVGSSQPIVLDVRVVAGTNLDVEQEVAVGRFRQDLFYRLNAVSIALPPLRERREDISSLAHSFADQIYSLNPAVTFSREAIELFEKYPWPGNIRELENAVVHAAAMCDGTIRPQDLPERIMNYKEQGASESEENMRPIKPETREKWVSLSEVEGRYVAQVLAHTGGNKQAAARLLGVDRKTLNRMIKRHNIPIYTRTYLSSRVA